jgi:uncharacterized protein (DUF1778 family)
MAKKSGRPVKSEAQKASTSFQFRLTLADRAIIEQAAARERRSIASYILHAVTEYERAKNK